MGAERERARPEVRVMVGERVEVDERLSQRVEELERTTRLLEERQGLPVQLLEATIGGMLENLRRSIEGGFFAEADERSLKLLLEGVEQVAEKFGPETRIGALRGGEYNPIFAGLRDLMDVINERTPIRGRMRGLPKDVTRFIQNITRGMIGVYQTSEEGRPARTGISHPALEVLSSEVLRALGKDVVTELPLYGDVEGRKVLQGILDVLGTYQATREYRGYHVTEVATGFAGRSKERQVADYASLIIDYAYKEHHGLDPDEYVDPNTVDKWYLEEVLPKFKQIYGDDIQKWPSLFKMGVLYTGGVPKELFQTRVWQQIQRRPGLRALWATRTLEPTFFRVPEEALLEAFARWDPQMEQEEAIKSFGADILERLKEMGLWDELTAFFNPLRVPREQVEQIFEEIVNQRLEQLQETGRTLDSITIEDIRPVIEQVRERTGATRTDMVRMGDARYGGISARVGRERRRDGRRPAIRYRFGRLEEAALAELIDLYGQVLEEEVTEEEEIERLAVAMMGAAVGRPTISEDIVQRREYRRLVREMGAEIAADTETGRDYARAPGRDGIEIGDSTWDQVLASRDLLAPFVGAIGMEVDLREYLRGMAKYTKELKDEFGVILTPQQYLRWAFEKTRGRLPAEILQDPEGIGGLLPALEVLRQQAEGQIGGPPFLTPRLTEYLGRVGGYEVPTGETLEMLREELSTLKQRINTMGSGDLGDEYAALIVRVASELEAFEKIYTRLEPATSIMVMRWS